MTQAVVQALQAIGLLNKGSADAAAAAAAAAAISDDALNVTRVGGVAAEIASAGAASLVLFGVGKVKDRASIVVSAYLATGAIVVAAENQGSMPPTPRVNAPMATFYSDGVSWRPIT